MAAIVISAGSREEYGYDGNGRVTKITEADGSTIESERNFPGKVTAVKDQRGKMTTCACDWQQRLVSVTNPLGKTMTYTYNDSAGSAWGCAAPGEAREEGWPP